MEEKMKKTLTVLVTCLMAFFFICGTSSAAKREKFGEDPRSKDAKRVSFKTSDEKIRWKMVMPWSKGLLFYDIAVHFADSVRLASAGRLDIKPFSAGELVPAMQSFDAVSQGAAQVGHTGPDTGKAKMKPLSPLHRSPLDWMQKGIISGSMKEAALN
jgi:TRAP-type C4-dicarboxylate transport system substrate-binding protein